VERDVARRMAGGVEDAQRADLALVLEMAVDRTGRMLGSSQRQAGLERPQPKGLHRPDRDRLRPAIARDDVRLPLVRPHRCAARALEGGGAAQVGAMTVGDDDVLQILRAVPEPAQRPEHAAPVRLEERVDEDEAVAAVEEEGADATALLASEHVDARRELHLRP
jgi:hypothetical protein